MNEVNTDHKVLDINDIEYLQKNKKKVIPEQNQYPYTIVWTSLPVINVCCPCIGHTGIGDSNGVIYDFAGSNYIGQGNLAFGKPRKYIELNTNQLQIQNYDQNVMEANQSYQYQEHDLCCNNCHSHVARALNNMNYKNKKDWTMVSVWCLTAFSSRYVDFNSCLKTYYQSFICYSLILIIILFSYYL